MQYPMPLVLPDDYTHARFQPAACNREALQLVEHFPRAGDIGAVIVGPPASGKTHLAHMWAQRVHARPIAAVDVIAPLTHAVVVDDAQACDAVTLFHLLNNAKSTHQPILLTCTTPPAAWSLLPDLTSRLHSFATAQLTLPDEAMLADMLHKYFTDQQLEVAPEVCHFLTLRIERSFRSARIHAEKLNLLALSEQRPITVHLARKLFNEEVSTGL